MKKITYILFGSFVCLSTACSTTPAELAAQSRQLHVELENARTAEDSTLIFKKIAETETRAREEFRKDELKEYERLAHSED